MWLFLKTTSIKGGLYIQSAFMITEWPQKNVEDSDESKIEKNAVYKVT